MRTTTSNLLSLACGAAVLVTACNSLLDNSPASMEVDAGGDATGPTQETSDATTFDATTPIQTPDASESVQTGDASACGLGQKSCTGACVSITDPAYGCGPTTCDPCSLPRATATCENAACAVSACDPGYSNCDGTAENGCETDLSMPATCGTCNAACGVAAPNCAPVGASFQCTTGCTAAAPTLCGNECADLQSSVDHCGDCNTACPALAHATVACTTGACTFTCKTGMANCDGIVSNGCESVLANDPKNCGACGKACPGTACQAGVCAAPKDAGAPPTDSGSPPADSGSSGSTDASSD